jgi:hypothetical protein
MSRASLAAIAKKIPQLVCTCKHSDQWHTKVGDKRCVYPGCKCTQFREKT